MSFAIDGVEIETEPVTMARLADGDTVIIPGHMIEVGDWTDGGLGQAQVVEIYRTEVVPTEYVS